MRRMHTPDRSTPDLFLASDAAAGVSVPLNSGEPFSTGVRLSAGVPLSAGAPHSADMPLSAGPPLRTEAASMPTIVRGAFTGHAPDGPTLAAARARVAAVRPAAYARTRNSLGGAVSGLSPYLTHGLVSLREVLAGVTARHALDVQHKFVYELGWRAYYRHVWQHRGEGILQSLHAGVLPDEAYARELPADIRAGTTGVPVIDQAVHTLYATGLLHNHARMWLASYVVHIRKVHWRAGADWLYGHLLDGDLASNHLSWQWVAGTGSNKPYLFNAENVANHAPPEWHSPGSVVDTSYEALDRIARDPSGAGTAYTAGAQPAGGHPAGAHPALAGLTAVQEPTLLRAPPEPLGATAPDPQLVKGRDVWLVHPWSLGELPEDLAPDSVVIGLFLSDFHQAWPWAERRFQFVASRMAEVTPHRWSGDSARVAAALAGAARVRCVEDPHWAPWAPWVFHGVSQGVSQGVSPWAQTVPAPALFPHVDRRCDSFSQWWSRATRGLRKATDLLPDPGVRTP